MARHRLSLSKLNWRSLLCWVGVLLVVGWGLSWFLNQTTPYLLALDAKTGHVQWTVMQNFVGSGAIANQQILIQHFSITLDGSQPGDYRWHLTSLDTASGKQRWTFQFDENVEGDYAVPLYVSSDTLYAFLRQGMSPTSRLVAIDINTGQLRWKKTQFWMPDQEPGIVGSGDRVIFLARAENGKPVLQAVEAQTGKPIWQAQLTVPQQQPNQDDFKLLSDSHYGLRANDRTIFFLGFNDAIYAFDIATGERQPILTTNVPTDNVINRIEVFDQTLYELSYTTVKARNLATGQENWSYSNSRATCKQEAIASSLQILATEKSVYLTCIDFQGTWLLALAPTDGQRQWLQRVSPSIHTLRYFPPQHLAANSDFVFVNKEAESSFNSDQIIAFSTQDGTEHWSVTLNAPDRDQSLITDGDRLYIRDSAPRWRSWLLHFSPHWF